MKKGILYWKTMNPKGSNQTNRTKRKKDDFEPSKSKGKSTDTMGQGVISIINSKNGKRVLFSRKLTEKLGHPESVQFSFKNTVIAIGVDNKNNNNRFSVKKYGARGVVYSADLVREITERYELDFTGSVSQTLDKVIYKKDGATMVAQIPIIYD